MPVPLGQKPERVFVPALVAYMESKSNAEETGYESSSNTKKPSYEAPGIAVTQPNTPLSNGNTPFNTPFKLDQHPGVRHSIQHHDSLSSLHHMMETDLQDVQFDITKNPEDLGLDERFINLLSDVVDSGDHHTLTVLMNYVNSLKIEYRDNEQPLGESTDGPDQSSMPFPSPLALDLDLALENQSRDHIDQSNHLSTSIGLQNDHMNEYFPAKEDLLRLLSHMKHSMDQTNDSWAVGDRTILDSMKSLQTSPSLPILSRERTHSEPTEVIYSDPTISMASHENMANHSQHSNPTDRDQSTQPSQQTTLLNRSLFNDISHHSVSDVNFNPSSSIPTISSTMKSIRNHVSPISSPSIDQSVDSIEIPSCYKMNKNILHQLAIDLNIFLRNEGSLFNPINPVPTNPYAHPFQGSRRQLHYHELTETHLLSFKYAVLKFNIIHSCNLNELSSELLQKMNITSPRQSMGSPNRFHQHSQSFYDYDVKSPKREMKSPKKTKKFSFFRNILRTNSWCLTNEVRHHTLGNIPYFICMRSN